MKRLILILSLVLNAAYAETIPVFGTDESPFLIGIVNNGSGCSGALLSPHVIVTAAHCVLDNNKKLTIGTKIDFDVNQYTNHLRPDFKESATVEKYHLVTSKKYFWSEEVWDEEWAILLSEKPIQLEKFPPILPYNELENIFFESKVTTYGYPAIRDSKRTRTKDRLITTHDHANYFINMMLGEDLSGISGGPTIVSSGKFKGYYAGAILGSTASRDYYRAIISYSEQLYKTLKLVTEADVNGANKDQLIQLLQ